MSVLLKLAYFKEALSNLAEFRQRQVFKFEAFVFCIVYSMVKTNNEEIGNLAKPRRVSLQGINSVVVIFCEGSDHSQKIRLGLDAL